MERLPVAQILLLLLLEGVLRCTLRERAVTTGQGSLEWLSQHHHFIQPNYIYNHLNILYIYT